MEPNPTHHSCGVHGLCRIPCWNDGLVHTGRDEPESRSLDPVGSGRDDATPLSILALSGRERLAPQHCRNPARQPKSSWVVRKHLGMGAHCGLTLRRQCGESAAGLRAASAGAD